jgi:hypothetical protein
VAAFREARDAPQYAMRFAKQSMATPALHGIAAGETFGRRLLDEDIISDPFYPSRGIEQVYRTNTAGEPA